MEEDVIKKLLEGNARFINKRKSKEQAHYERLVDEGQDPDVLVITCSDSRLLTSTIFDQEAGSLFVVRNVGGFVPEYEADDHSHGTTAAIEFAVCILKVRAAVILTHSHCTGVAQATKPKDQRASDITPVLANWLNVMNLPVGFQNPHHAEEIAARTSLENLSKLPCVKVAMAEKKLIISAMHFDIASGAVRLLEQR